MIPILLYLLFLFCLFLFFFCVFVFAKDDFTILRKNITLSQIFDLTFVMILFSLLSSRLFFVLLHFTKGYLNPFVFFLVPYFPGMSLFGAILGAVLATLFLSRNKKFPTLKLLDIFSLSFFASFLFWFFVTNIVSLVTKKPHFSFVYLLLFPFIAFFVFFLRRYAKGKYKEGTIALLFFIVFSFLSLLSDVVSMQKRVVWVFGYEDILFIVSMFLSFGFLLTQEKFLLKGKRK